MARKKPLTYNDVVRTIAEMQQLLGARKRHMVEVLADAMDDRTAAMLGDFSDAELHRLAHFMFANARLFVNLSKNNTLKLQQSQNAEDASMVDGEIRYNYDKNCWEIWDTETGKQIGTLQDGMQVDLFCDHDESWIPTKVGMYITDLWYFNVGKDVPDYLGNMIDGLRVRCHRLEQK